MLAPVRAGPARKMPSAQYMPPWAGTQVMAHDYARMPMPTSPRLSPRNELAAVRAMQSQRAAAMGSSMSPRQQLAPMQGSMSPRGGGMSPRGTYRPTSARMPFHQPSLP